MHNDLMDDKVSELRCKCESYPPLVVCVYMCVCQQDDYECKIIVRWWHFNRIWCCYFLRLCVILLLLLFHLVRAFNSCFKDKKISTWASSSPFKRIFVRKSDREREREGKFTPCCLSLKWNLLPSFLLVMQIPLVYHHHQHPIFLSSFLPLLLLLLLLVVYGLFCLLWWCQKEFRVKYFFRHEIYFWGKKKWSIFLACTESICKVFFF